MHVSLLNITHDRTPEKTFSLKEKSAITLVALFYHMS